VASGGIDREVILWNTEHALEEEQTPATAQTLTSRLPSVPARSLSSQAIAMGAWCVENA
jgi:hypothetical protein